MRFASFLLLLALVSALPGRADTPIAMPAAVISDESRSPEGNGYANCQILFRKGDTVESTLKTVPASVVEDIRQLALQSKSGNQLDLNDFGITRESVEKNRDLMVRHACSQDSRYNHVHVTERFKSASPSVVKLSRSTANFPTS